MSSQILMYSLLLVVILPSITPLTIPPQQTSVVQQQVLYSGTRTLKGIQGTRFCGYYSDLPFQGTHGEEITGSLSSDIPVTFYVMTDAAFTGFVNGENCVPGGTASDLLVHQEAVTSLSVDFKVNYPDKHHFLFLNENQKTATITYSFAVVGSAATSTST